MSWLIFNFLGRFFMRDRLAGAVKVRVPVIL